MRITLTLDPEVVRLLKEAAHRLRTTFKETVNEALRRGLSPRARGAGSKRYRVRPHQARLRPGLDSGHLNSLADEAEDLAIVTKRRARRRA